jgi:hypothetical protein
LAATSASEGACKWTADLNEWFCDRIVHILPDNDQKGAEHAEQIAQNLAGVAQEVRIVRLPGLATSEDVYDWITRGGTREQLDALGDATPKWAPAQETIADHDRPKPPPRARDNTTWRERLIEAASLCHKRFEPVRYVVPALFPEGVTLLASRPKLGLGFCCR